MRKGRTPILTLFISSLLLINTVMVSEDIRASNDRIKEEKTLANKSFASIHHMLYSQMYKHMIEMMKHELRILRELSKILPENMHSSQNQDHGKVKSSRGKGRTLYVGGTGPNNYTKIQDAINEANDGDTIFVYSGVYKENLVINKTINLIGEKRETTIVNGSNGGNHEIIIDIHADNVVIQNFTLRFGTFGIYIYNSNYNTITNVIVEHCGGCIVVETFRGNSNYNTITNTTVRDCMYGILILSLRGNSNYNTITNTTVRDCMYGILILSLRGNSNYNTITNTTVESGEFGINYALGISIISFFGNSNNNIIENSVLNNCTTFGSIAVFIAGLLLGNSNNNIIENLTVNNYSDSTSIVNASVAASVGIGIAGGFLGNSNNNIIENLTVNNCGAGVYIVAYLGNSNNNIIENSILNNCPGGIWIIGENGKPNNNKIKNSTVNHCGVGVFIVGSKYNVIENSTLNSCEGMGICIAMFSHYNRVVNNLIADNSIGIMIIGVTSSGNIFYLNRLINNSKMNALAFSKNKWDNGRVGNYWDDYNGTDSNGDGIGDIPYEIPPFGKINRDRYPLGRFLTNITPPPEKNPPKIRLKEPLPAAIYVGKHPLEIAFFVPLLWNKTLVFFSTKGITIKVAAIDYESGIDRVEFYVDDETKPRDIEIKQYPEQYIFEWCWDETMLCEEHVVRAVAYDKANNSATLTINIKVILSVHLYRIWQ